MTDLEKVISLLIELGVVYTEEEWKGRHHVNVPTHGGPRNSGYAGFVSTFEFDKEGGFIEMGAWE